MDGVFAEGYVGEGAIFRVDARDATDEEVGGLQIEEGGVDEGCDGRGCVDLGFASCQLADRAIFQTMCLWKERREPGDGNVVSEQVAN